MKILENMKIRFCVSREKALAAHLRVPQNAIEKSQERKNNFKVHGVEYAVRTDQERKEEVYSYFRNDISNYWFQAEFLAGFLSETAEELQKDPHFQWEEMGRPGILEVCGNSYLIQKLEENQTFNQMVDAFVLSTGGYGYFINQYDHTEIKINSRYYLYRWE